jgi:hypothetical protein
MESSFCFSHLKQFFLEEKLLNPQEQFQSPVKGFDFKIPQFLQFTREAKLEKLHEIQFQLIDFKFSIFMESSFCFSHLKQFFLEEKLLNPQEQFQSPGNGEFPQFLQFTREEKFEKLQDLQFQSPDKILFIKAIWLAVAKFTNF